MRLYSLVNHYLSPIQHGIQTAHVMGELFDTYMTKHNYGTEKCNHLIDWNANHKTIIVLNGGFSSELKDIYDIISKNSCYPVAKFHEGKNELNGALTAVGIVLPERVYNIPKTHLTLNISDLSYQNGTQIIRVSPEELEIAKILSTLRLA